MRKTHFAAMKAEAEADSSGYADTPRRPHWIVGTHHRMRTASFANAFVFCGLHIWGQGYGPLAWIPLALLFLVYPHLVFWRACRAPDTQRAELQNLLLDCLLVGMCVALLGFPLWIAFTLFVSSAVNNAFTRGFSGAVSAIATFAAGALVGSAATGFALSLDNSGWVTVLCVLGLSWYLVTISHVAYLRALTLRSVRERLKLGEQALQAANENLRGQLHQIRVLQQQLQEQANRDPLTGLFNRRYLQVTMERELSRCGREGTPLCVMILDIDHFKRVNDDYGHQVGDEVLRRLAQLLANDARQEDVACRFGGEEFLMLLPKMPLQVAIARAERWCEAFAAVEVPTRRGVVRCTLSVGVACFPDHGADADTLTRHADQALYQAKNEGRNRVVVYTSTETIM